MAETLIEHRDVTGALLSFSVEQIQSLIEGMPPDRRPFARVLAETIVKPHEIWQAWVADETQKGHWHNLRSYIQFLDLSKMEPSVPFGAAIVQFAYRSRWELVKVGLLLADEDAVIARLNEDIRRGSIEYSRHKH